MYFVDLNLHMTKKKIMEIKKNHTLSQYYFYYNFTAVGSKLCDPCDSSTLSCESELVCSSDTYVCECPPGQVQIGDFCCKKIIVFIIVR